MREDDIRHRHTIADVVRFVPLRDLAAETAASDPFRFPEVVELALCQKPVKSKDDYILGEKKVSGLYKTTCAFENNGASTPPLLPIYGMRSLIEFRGDMIIDLKSNLLGLERLESSPLQHGKL